MSVSFVITDRIAPQTHEAFERSPSIPRTFRRSSSHWWSIWTAFVHRDDAIGTERQAAPYSCKFLRFVDYLLFGVQFKVRIVSIVLLRPSSH